MTGSDERMYDRNRAIAQLDGDAALFAEICALFVAECDTYCRALESAWASGDAVSLRREAHTLKSMLARFACETGRELALRLEQRVAAGELEGTGEMLVALVSEAKRLAAALEQNAG